MSEYVYVDDPESLARAAALGEIDAALRHFSRPPGPDRRGPAGARTRT